MRKWVLVSIVCIRTCVVSNASTRILDVARDFPHCSTVAVDLVPMQVLSVLFSFVLACSWLNGV